MIDITPVVDVAATWLVTVVWPATLVAALALVLLPWLRRVSPAAAMAVAALALARFFLPPLVVAPLALVPEVVVPIVPASNTLDLSLRTALVVAYAAGVVWMTAQVRRRQGHLTALVAASDRVDWQLAARPARALGLRTMPEVRLSDAVDGPLALGIRRPAILLPRQLAASLSPRQLEIVVAHELAHHRGRDLWLEHALTWATVVYWFHPLVWRLAARVREIREERCDDRVIALGIDAYEYCCTLREVAVRAHPSLALAMAAPAPVARRMRRLMEWSTPAWTRRTAALLLAIAFACVAAPAAAPPPIHSPDEVKVIVTRDVRVHRVVR